MEIKDLHPTDKVLYELNQELLILFAFAKVEGSVIGKVHQFVKCRDFLGDVVNSTFSKQAFSIYGFDFNPYKQQIDLENTTLLLKIENKKNYNKLLKNNKLLNEIESKNGLQLTQFIPVDEEHILVSGDKFWQQTVFNISLYTYLIKVSSIPCRGSIWDKLLDLNTNEGDYYIKVSSTLPKLLNNLGSIPIDTPTGFTNSPDIYQTHNCCGFTTMIRFMDFSTEQNKIKQYLVGL